jgi:excisionase family DNA binding protein
MIMTTMIEDQYITLTECAKVLGLSRSMIHYLIRDRELPARRFGPKAWLVRRLDAERLKEKRAAR